MKGQEVFRAVPFLTGLPGILLSEHNSWSPLDASIESLVLSPLE